MKKFVYRWANNMFHSYLWHTIALFFILFFLASVFIIYYFESEQNSDLTFIESFRIGLIILLGEYDDLNTNMGKFMSLLLFILGIFVVATLIGKITAVFVELNRGVKMPTNIENHIIICNWHRNGERIVEELHSEQANPDINIIIISETEINEIELRLRPEYEKVFFVRSDPTLHLVLNRAGVHVAKSIIILSDPNYHDPDAKSALIALAITKCDQKQICKVRIIAEVNNPNKIQHLIDAGVDEWVCSTDFGLGILAQSALYGKLSNVYQQLLTYSADTNEVYLLNNDKYPKSFLGKKFHEIVELLNQKRNLTNPVIIIGIKRYEQVILNPKENQFDELKDTDSLIVISFDPPDLKHF
ncbi:MAG: NAD-binding protein [Thiomargarita sp.]|nr:NAD-binding protein [Thiomargarita sp.]